MVSVSGDGDHTVYFYSVDNAGNQEAQLYACNGALGRAQMPAPLSSEIQEHLKKQGLFDELPIVDYVAATSVGRVGGEVLLDLNYEEDSKADVDMNVVKTGRGLFVEVQGTAEHKPFSEEEMNGLMSAADKGIQQLIGLQKTILGEGVLKKERPGS